MKVLFFGDVIGKIGRKGLIKVLPEMKAEYEPDFIIANGENLAHGIGITQNTAQELRQAGVDFFTSGNHIFSKPEAEMLLTAADSTVVRPANYPPTASGPEYRIVEIGSKSIAIISMLGRVFMRENFDCPFRKIDELLIKINQKNLAGIFIDFHAEATSEKKAFGWYVDGRVTAVLGTHTHVPTCDHVILPNQTAYVSDVGMVGATNSVIGDTKEPILKSFLTQTPASIEIPESGEVEIGAVLVEFDPATKLATMIKRVDRKVIV